MMLSGFDWIILWLLQTNELLLLNQYLILNLSISITPVTQFGSFFFELSRVEEYQIFEY